LWGRTYRREEENKFQAVEGEKHQTTKEIKLNFEIHREGGDNYHPVKE